MLVSIGEAKRRITGMGKDSSGLERWVWSLYSGRNNIKLRAISAYLCGT